MKNLILFHGKPKKEKYYNPLVPKPNNANWFPYVIEGARERGITTYAPSIPAPYDPQQKDTLGTFNNMPIHEESTLVGHSMGARIILEGMSVNGELEVDKLILVASWLDPRGNYPDLGTLAIDSSLIERSRRGMTVFYSSEDDVQARESHEIVRELFPQAQFRNIPEYGHFMLGNTMKNAAFPEMLEEL